MNDKQGEIRQNKATRQWVIFAPSRGKRPRDFMRPKEEKPALPSYDPKCPFCPGNEHMLTPVILELRNQYIGAMQGWRTAIALVSADPAPHDHPGRF